MAQGQFTKHEAQHAIETVDQMFRAIPKRKALEYIGHLNDVLLFRQAAKRAAPEEKKL